MVTRRSFVFAHLVRKRIGRPPLELCRTSRRSHAPKPPPRVSMLTPTPSIHLLTPPFSEGVNKTAVSAITLDAALRQSTTSSIGKTYFKLLAARTEARWNNSKLLDYGRDTTIPCEGESLEEGAWIRKYIHTLYKCMSKVRRVVGC
jgi:hypothetical protein